MASPHVPLPYEDDPNRPPEGNYHRYPLSNGKFATIQSDATPEEVKSAIADEEQKIRDASPGGRFRTAVENAIPTTGVLGDYVNTMKKQAGNAAEFFAPVAKWASPVTHYQLPGGSSLADLYKGGWESAGRIGSAAYGGLADLPGHVINVGRHVYGALGGDIDRTQDYPENAGYNFFRNALNLPEASTPVQSFLEHAAGASLYGGPTGLTGLALTTGGSTLGSEALGAAGRAVGGPVGEEVGNLVGGIVGGNRAPYEQTFGRGARYFFGAPEAPDIAAAGLRQRPSYVNPEGPDRNAPPPNPNRLDTNPNAIPVSTRSLSNEPGQSITNFFGALPIVGQPIRNANYRTSAGTEAILRDVQDQLSQGRVRPGVATTGEQGATFQQGARNAVRDANAAEDAAWDPINNTMRGREASALPVFQATSDALANNRTTPSVTDAVRRPVQELQQITPGGERYDRDPTGRYGPGSMEVPFSALKDFRTDLRKSMQGDNFSVPGNIKIPIREAATNAMETATAQAGLPTGTLANAENASRTADAVYETYRPVTGENFGQQFDEPSTGAQGSASVARRVMQDPAQMRFAQENFRDPDFNDFVATQASTLGSRKGEDSFRPEHFAEDYRNIPPESRDIAFNNTVDANGQPIVRRPALEDAATVGANAVTAPQRHGLQNMLVMSNVLGQALTKGGAALMAGLGGGVTGHDTGIGAAATSLALPWLISKGLESQTYKNALAGRTSDWSTVAGDVPLAATITNYLYGQPQQNQPDQSQAPQGMFP